MKSASSAKLRHSPVSIFEGATLVTGAIDDLRTLLEEGLATGAKRIVVEFEGTTLERSQLEKMVLSNSDVVFAYSGTKLAILANLVLKTAYNLLSASSPLCSAICFSRQAAMGWLANGKDGMRLMLEESRSTRTLVVESYKIPGPLNLKFYLRLLKLAFFTSALSSFLFVGVSGAIVNTLIVALQVHFLGFKPFLAVPFAFEASVGWNFVFNDKYTFRGGSDKRLLRLLKYNSSSIFSFFIQLVSVYTLTEYLRIHYLIATVVGIGLGFCANYFLSVKIWRGAGMLDAQSPVKSVGIG